MKYYKNNSNQIFGFESDGSQDEHITVDMVEISEEDAKKLASDSEKKSIDEVKKNWTYADKRSSEYPPIGDQLDALWKGGAAQEEMAQRVKAVKEKYPKPE